jgi:hypothetical protein
LAHSGRDAIAAASSTVTSLRQGVWILLGLHDLCGTPIEAAAVKRRRRYLPGDDLDDHALGTPGSTVVHLGSYDPGTAWPMDAAFIKEVALRPSLGYCSHHGRRRDFAEAADLLAARRS